MGPAGDPVERTGPEEPAEELGSGPSIRALAASGRRIGLAAVVLALFVPLLIPGLHAHKLFPGRPRGTRIRQRAGPRRDRAWNPLVLMTDQLNLGSSAGGAHLHHDRPATRSTCGCTCSTT